jgi:hypothetical protein
MRNRSIPLPAYRFFAAGLRETTGISFSSLQVWRDAKPAPQYVHRENFRQLKSKTPDMPTK